MNTTATLTKRELQVTELLAWGASKKEVPMYLSKKDGSEISVQTVEVITKHIYQKLGIQKVSELVVWYFCNNFHISMDLSPLRRRIIAVIFLALVGTAEVLSTADFLRPSAGRSLRLTCRRQNASRRRSENTFEMPLA